MLKTSSMMPSIGTLEFAAALPVEARELWQINIQDDHVTVDVSDDIWGFGCKITQVEGGGLLMAGAVPPGAFPTWFELFDTLIYNWERTRGGDDWLAQAEPWLTRQLSDYGYVINHQQAFGFSKVHTKVIKPPSQEVLPQFSELVEIRSGNAGPGEVRSQCLFIAPNRRFNVYSKSDSSSHQLWVFALPSLELSIHDLPTKGDVDYVATQTGLLLFPCPPNFLSDRARSQQRLPVPFFLAPTGSVLPAPALARKNQFVDSVIVGQSVLLVTGSSKKVDAFVINGHRPSRIHGPIPKPRVGDVAIALPNGNFWMASGTPFDDPDDTETVESTTIFVPKEQRLYRGPRFPKGWRSLNGAFVLTADNRAVVYGRHEPDDVDPHDPETMFAVLAAGGPIDPIESLIWNGQWSERRPMPFDTLQFRYQGVTQNLAIFSDMNEIIAVSHMTGTVVDRRTVPVSVRQMFPLHDDSVLIVPKRGAKPSLVSFSGAERPRNR